MVIPVKVGNKNAASESMAQGDSGGKDKTSSGLPLFFIASAFFLQSLIWLPVVAFFSLFGNMKITGKNRLKEAAALAKKFRRGVLLVANHIGQLDPVLISAAMPFFFRMFPVLFVSGPKERYQHIPGGRFFYGGLLFRCFGAFPAILGLKNYSLSLALHEKLLKRGKTLLVFPEGRVNVDGTTMPPRGGAGYLAAAAKPIIMPVGVSGSRNFSLLDGFFGRQKIKISFGAPFPAENLPEIKNAGTETYQAVAEILMKKTRALLLN